AQRHALQHQRFTWHKALDRAERMHFQRALPFTRTLALAPARAVRVHFTDHLAEDDRIGFGRQFQVGGYAVIARNAAGQRRAGPEKAERGHSQGSTPHCAAYCAVAGVSAAPVAGSGAGVGASVAASASSAGTFVIGVSGRSTGTAGAEGSDTISSPLRSSTPAS